MNDDKILSMIMSSDDEMRALGCITLSMMEKEEAIAFMEKVGEVKYKFAEGHCQLTNFHTPSNDSVSNMIVVKGKDFTVASYIITWLSSNDRDWSNSLIRRTILTY